MTNLIEQVAQLLGTHTLEAQRIRGLDIPEAQTSALAMDVNAADAIRIWQVLKDHLNITQHYPLIVEGWGSEDFFSRFYYQEEQTQGLLHQASPDAIVVQAKQTPIADFLESQKSETIDYLEETIPVALEEINARYGTSPDLAEIKQLMIQNQIKSIFDLEQWLWQWELANNDLAHVLAPGYTDYLDWFDPKTPKSTILLVPTLNSWDTLAFIHWYGSCRCGSPVAISFLRHWYQNYGAELVCHYGTMLQLQLSRIPSNPTEAFQLAWEQVALAPCTIVLPGISLRDHARSLMTTTRWFLHERP